MIITWAKAVGFHRIYVVQPKNVKGVYSGFALAPLQKRTNPLRASLILGIIWAVWPLPLFFIEGTTQAAIPLYQYFLQTIVFSIFYTWLHNNTGGSVLVAIIFHAVSNTSAVVAPFWTTELGRWIDFGILFIAAVVVLLTQWNKWQKPTAM